MSEYFRMSLYGLCLPEAVLEPDCPVPSRRNHHSLLREGEDCNWIRRPMFQPWCSFKVCNNGERSITDVLISSTQMTQLHNNSERLWALSPAQLHWCRQEKAKSWRRKQVTTSKLFLCQCFISFPAASTHVQLVQMKNLLWIYVSQAWPHTVQQPFLFFGGQSSGRAGVLAVQVNMAKSFLLIPEVLIFKCKFAFCSFGQGATFGPVNLAGMLASCGAATLQQILCGGNSQRSVRAKQASTGSRCSAARSQLTCWWDYLCWIRRQARLRTCWSLLRLPQKVSTFVL